MKPVKECIYLLNVYAKKKDRFDRKREKSIKKTCKYFKGGVNYGFL